MASCDICGKKLKSDKQLKAHLKGVHLLYGPVKQHHCLKCSYKTPHKGNLKVHLRNKHSNKKNKKQNRPLLLNVAGLPAPEPVIGFNFNQLLDEGYNHEAMRCLAESWYFVRTSYSHRSLSAKYNIRLKTEDVEMSWVKGMILKIHNLQSTAYRINLGFGCLMQHIETKEWKYFYSADSKGRYWDAPMRINNQSDLLKALEYMDTQDITDHLTLKRENTKYVLKRIVNVNIVLFLLTEHPLLGKNVTDTFAPHIVKHQYVLPFRRNTVGTLYNDSLCCFRCISYHLYGNNKILTHAKHLAEKFRIYAKIPKTKFDGNITLDQLYLVEQCFDLKISVYTLVPILHEENADNQVLSLVEEPTIEQFEAHLIRPSPKTLKEAKNGELNLDCTEGHLSVITSIEHYAHSFACTNCLKLFKVRKDCKIHQTSCFKTDRERAIYIGGAYKPTKNLFSELEELGFQINPEDKFCSFYSVFDFETVNKILDKEDPRCSTGQKLTFERVLELCSCSVNSSVPGFNRPIFIRRHTTENEFMSRVVECLCKIAERSETMQKERFDYLFKQIESRIAETTSKIENDNADNDIKGFHGKILKRLKQLQKKLDTHTKNHVVYAFNGSRFDLKVARSFLLEQLLERNMKIKLVIKRHSAYTLLATDTLIFKDMACLLGPGTSLDKFLKSFDLPVSKWAFPYSYITSLEKLDEKDLPPYSEFWNSLKNQYLVTEEEYKQIAHWYKQNANCLWDYLEEYNNRDVHSMIPGLEKLRQFWKSYNICMITEGISLSSLSSRLMFKLVPDDKPFVWLPRKESRRVYDMATESVVGGPALVWKRYAEKNISIIRKGPNVCKSILGLDANALYLLCLSKHMPCSYPVSWKSDDDGNTFRKKIEIPPWTSVAEIEYCFCMQHFTKDPNLRHVYNYGQTTFGDKKYKPDAYSARDNALYHYFGCYWHFCSKCPVGQRRTINDPDNAKIRRGEDNEMLEYFNKLNFKQHIMTDCEWSALKRSKPEYKQFIDRKLKMPLSNNYELTKNELLEKIKSGELFGFAKVSLHVPQERYEQFKEFCPIFKTRLVTKVDLSPYALKIAEEQGLLKHGRKTLISVMKADDIVLITPLIQWYMKHGLVISDISEVIQFKPSRLFTEMTENVTNHRKAADLDPNKKQLGELHKLTGNAAYGKTLERKSNFVKVAFANESHASKLVNRKEFLDLEQINDDLFEVTLAKMRYLETVPRIIGAFVLGLAKLHLLQMYYEFLDKYFDRSHWESICADTDSLYMAVAAESLEQFETMVKPEMRDEYKTTRKLFLSTDKSTQRQPGLFKLEYWGTGIVSLAPKLYCVWNDENDTSKISCKGINQRDKLEKDKYLEVLHSERDMELENVGLRFKDGHMYQYKQRKRGLIQFFIKRRLNEDGITTEPIFE